MADETKRLLVKFYLPTPLPTPYQPDDLATLNGLTNPQLPVTDFYTVACAETLLGGDGANQSYILYSLKKQPALSPTQVELRFLFFIYLGQGGVPFDNRSDLTTLLGQGWTIK